jgi:hypothetical protein
MYTIHKPALASKIREGEKKNRRKCGILWHFVASHVEMGKMVIEEKKADSGEWTVDGGQQRKQGAEDGGRKGAKLHPPGAGS